MNSLSGADLDAYCAPLKEQCTHRELATRAGLSVDAARRYLDAICNEAHAALRLLQWAGFQATDRVLEVGAGGGLFSGFLQSRGIDLVAVEPAAAGFEATHQLAGLVSEATGISPTIHPLGARDVQPGKFGTFDLIFSVNVIEHFQPMTENLDALAHLMADDGTQVHTCPNYRVPYEPHYGIPLLPWAPHLTPWLGGRKLLTEGLWQSLNFITATDLRAYARRWNLSISFKSGTLWEAFDRLLVEPAFAARQPKFFRRVAAAMKATRLSSVIEQLPPAWVTPMSVILRRGVTTRRR